MKKTLRFLSLILALAMITALAMTLSSCKGEQQETPSQPSSEATEPSTEAVTALHFTCDVTLGSGEEKTLEYDFTDGQTVGEVMLAAEDIAGEDGEYGLYVKSVLGEEHDYSADGTYWAFYINGEYAMTGVDATTAEDGAKYAFKVEK